MRNISNVEAVIYFVTGSICSAIGMAALLYMQYLTRTP